MPLSICIYSGYTDNMAKHKSIFENCTGFEWDQGNANDVFHIRHPYMVRCNSIAVCHRRSGLPSPSGDFGKTLPLMEREGVLAP